MTSVNGSCLRAEVLSARHFLPHIQTVAPNLWQSDPNAVQQAKNFRTVLRPTQDPASAP